MRLCLWSGPRNVSTALMYSFGRRDDTEIVDEPLYGHYLRVTGARHPDAEEVMASMDTDGERVVQEVILGPMTHRVRFMKHMAHHLVELDLTFLNRTINVVLIRDPVEVVRSFAKRVPEPTPQDVGLERQAELFDHLVEIGMDPVVLDARELLTDPESVLQQLCRRLGLPFTERMLTWPAGPRPEDGVWARHWYADVHRTTGFLPVRPNDEPLPPRLQAVADACLPFYESLYRHAIRAHV